MSMHTHGTQKPTQRQGRETQTEQPWQEIVALLPAEISQQARGQGAFHRARGLREPLDLLRGILAYVFALNSFRQVSGWASSVHLSPNGARSWAKRTRQAAGWLLWIVDLVKRSVDALRKDKQRVSLSTVTAKSKELDTESNGKRISESAILDNQEARAYYEQYRSWQGSSRQRAKPLVVTLSASPRAVKPGWDEQRVRQRYLHMTKETLVERLIAAERTRAEQRERWLTQQDEALIWRLRAETAEMRLKNQ
ncbi:MAG TPA: hypothetical protein VFN35_24850 [Ktedonobacteraceae bacterium]|nr:hypothetical protein [Ktedonobacteraceae bacterium]